MALLAYSDPKTSPVAYLLAEAQRTVVADALNQVILSNFSFIFYLFRFN